MIKVEKRTNDIYLITLPENNKEFELTQNGDEIFIRVAPHEYNEEKDIFESNYVEVTKNATNLVSIGYKTHN